MPTRIHRKSILALAIASAAAVGVMGSRAHAAATATDWSGATSTDWTVATNWSAGAPANNLTDSIAEFDGTAAYKNQPNAGTISVGAIQFGDGTAKTVATTITGTNITLGNAIAGGIGIEALGNAGTASSGGGAQTINSSITLGADQTWLNASTVALNIGVAGTSTINSNGFALALSNTSTGATTLNIGSGSTSFSSITSTSTGAFILNNTGTGTLSTGAVNTVGAMTINNSGAGNITIAGNVSLGAGGLALNGSGSGAATLSGTIGGTGPLTVNGSVVIDGAANYTGTTGLVSTTTGTSGAIEYAATSGTETLGTLTISNKGSLTIQADAGTEVLTFSNLGTVTAGSTADLVVGAGSTIKIGAGTSATGVLAGGPYLTIGTGANTQYVATIGGAVGGFTTGTPAPSANAFVSATANYDYSLGGGTDTLSTATGAANTVHYTGSGETINTNGIALTLEGILNAGTGALTINGTGTLGVAIGATSGTGVLANELVLNAANADIAFTGQYNYASTTAQFITLAGPHDVSFNQINNTNTGTLTINGAGNVSQLYAGGAQSLTFNTTSSGGIVVNSNLADNAAGTSNINVTASTTGVVTFNGLNTYTGVTTINSAILAVALLGNVNTASGLGLGSAGGSPGDLVLGNGTLRYVGSTNSTTNRQFTIGDASGNIATLDNSGTSATGISFTNTANIVFGTTGAHTLGFAGTQGSGANLVSSANFAPVIVDSGTGATSVTMTGTGSNMWTLSGVNTYSGGTLISGGSLRITNLSGFGTGPVTVTSGGNAFLSSATGVFTNNFVIAGDGPTLTTTVGYMGGAITLLAGATVGDATSTITLAGAARISGIGAGAGGVAVTIAGQLTGTGNLTLGNTTGGNGAGNPTFIISNPLNNFVGDVTLLNNGSNGSGTTVLVRLGASEVIPDGSTLILNHGGAGSETFDANGKSETIAGLSSAGTGNDLLRVVTNSATGNSIITLGSAASQNFMGSITDTSTTASLGITKVGTGTQTFGGAAYTYRGNTTITGGTVALDYNQYASSSLNPSNAFSVNTPVILNGGTLLVLGRNAGLPGTPTTSALAVGATTMTLSNVAGLVPGQIVNVAGVPGTAYIVAISGNTITISAAVTTAIVAGTTVNFNATPFSTAQTFKSLTLAASSALDFGTGGPVVMTFGAESQTLDGTVLTIHNWAGTPNTGGGADQLLFTIPDVSAFEATFSQSEIAFDGFTPGYGLVNQNGNVWEVVPVTAPVPEPASLALLGLGAAAMLMRRRRGA